jgi:hypothetical protein
MRNRFPYVRCAVLGSITVGAMAVTLAQQPQGLPAPTYIPQTKFETGQDVVPAYEGWIRNPDGTFDFVFGYFNRNFKEEFAIPAGPDNIVEPGGPDRGQPTYFLPRRHTRIFRVRVPKDWGTKTLTWSITANGRTENVYADLRPVEEINEEIMQSGGNSVPFEPGNTNPNEPPSITVRPPAAASASTPLSLVANVTDDGLPKPPPPRVPPPQPPTTDPNGQLTRQVNGAGGGRGTFRGLTVSWFEYGGPAKVTFNPSGPVSVVNGVATVTASFPVAGTYKLVATANDTQLSTKADVTVTVK